MAWQLRQTLEALSTATAQGTQVVAPQAVATLASTPPTGAEASAAVPTAEAPSVDAPSVDATSSAPPFGVWNVSSDDDAVTFHYYTQAGDTLQALSGRFEVEPSQIIVGEEQRPDQPLPAGLLPPGLYLSIPNTLDTQSPPYPQIMLPDSELIYSPSAADFDVEDFVDDADGYLDEYTETVQGEQLSGAQIVQRVALESSVNPRFLLALLEYQSGWVFGQPVDQKSEKYPIGFNVAGWEGLYKELVITATHLNMAYYGWRQGEIVEMKYTDGSRVRMSPELNAGSATVQHLLAKLYDPAPWDSVLFGPNNFLDFYKEKFGDAWARAAKVEPLFPPGLSQPLLELPFQPGERWSLTGGPHESWKTGSPRGALDLAPVTGEAECAVSKAWVTASAAGLVVRSARNAVVIDLDGDGSEATGWTVLYFHIADKERIAAGTRVEVDDHIGHPSCEGGNATGTHVHIARKYNGEWITADGPLPFVMSGWQVIAYVNNYQGELRKGEQKAIASPVGPGTSIVTR
ncbi:MAG: M23 family metallopeptidase [Anaerolineales bacterium]|nr:M23 family metallopeptidase [Anaerolineales bacterium]